MHSVKYSFFDNFDPKNSKLTPLSPYQPPPKIGKETLHSKCRAPRRWCCEFLFCGNLLAKICSACPRVCFSVFVSRGHENRKRSTTKEEPTRNKRRTQRSRRLEWLRTKKKRNPPDNRQGSQKVRLNSPGKSNKEFPPDGSPYEN